LLGLLLVLLLALLVLLLVAWPRLHWQQRQLCWRTPAHAKHPALCCLLLRLLLWLLVLTLLLLRLQLLLLPLWLLLLGCWRRWRRLLLLLPPTGDFLANRLPSLLFISRCSSRWLCCYMAAARQLLG
jgi:hypothetical protein